MNGNASRVTATALKGAPWLSFAVLGASLMLHAGSVPAAHCCYHVIVVDRIVSKNAQLLERKTTCAVNAFSNISHDSHDDEDDDDDNDHQCFSAHEELGMYRPTLLPSSSQS